ncbi:hypothetical protein Van01_46410 [Micromonospora andamanensis]|uniref:Uncharacterized protein n=1 Tax=Micromonospora andamanensis TaxID=1287068 RepID=A0ABQ4I0M8_9ACTN|nr:hypothetical protein Van01_46410 [Micromonospora andamanensis]
MPGLPCGTDCTTEIVGALRFAVEDNVPGGQRTADLVHCGMTDPAAERQRHGRTKEVTEIPNSEVWCHLLRGT